MGRCQQSTWKFGYPFSLARNLPEQKRLEFNTLACSHRGRENTFITMNDCNININSVKVVSLKIE